MNTNPTPLTTLNQRQLTTLLQDLCNSHGLQLEDSYDGYEIHQQEANMKRRFVIDIPYEYKLDFTNSDESGQHSIRVLHAIGYDEFNTNTLKKNLRNAIRLLTSNKTLFEYCEGCENCEQECLDQ